MGKVIQISATAEDLFALDNEGRIWRYVFQRESWIELSPPKAESPSTPPLEMKILGEEPPVRRQTISG